MVLRRQPSRSGRKYLGKLFDPLIMAVRVLEDIVYRDASGEIIDTFLTQPEIDHLNDVARLIAHLSGILSYLAAILGVLVMVFWIRQSLGKTSIYGDLTLSQNHF